jgi:molybdenum cofactor biosynthesis enzyme
MIVSGITVTGSTDTIVRTTTNTKGTTDDISDLKNAIMIETAVMTGAMTAETTDAMTAVMTGAMTVMEIIKATGIPGKKIGAINRKLSMNTGPRGHFTLEQNSSDSTCI